jgi:hypothetical protein
MKLKPLKLLVLAAALLSVVPAADAVLVQEGITNTYNVTSATVIKPSLGRVYHISIVVAGSAAGTLNDAATTGSAAASNEIMALPNTVEVIDVNWPTTTGIVVVPGTGQTIAISWE